MIQPTPKAQTLPDDLKKHWENAMADKFPMTAAEACAYIRNHYMRCSPTVNDQGQVIVSVEVNKQVSNVQTIGIDPELARRIMGTSITTGTTNANSLSHTVRGFDYVTITDFKKSTIDEQLKDYK